MRVRRGRTRLPHLQKATCHPNHAGRWAVQDGCCIDCIPRTPTMVIADGPAPAACQHCHTPPPGWNCDDLSGRCWTCGQRWNRRIMAAYL